MMGRRSGHFRAEVSVSFDVGDILTQLFMSDHVNSVKCDRAGVAALILFEELKASLECM